jgi:nucleoid DNA-binding protein
MASDTNGIPQDAVAGVRQTDHRTRPLIKVCADCGGTWFRESTVGEYLPKETENITLAWAREVGPISRMPITLLFCLCGAPFRPPGGGVRGGRTPNHELVCFWKSFGRTEQWNQAQQNFACLEREAADTFVAKDQLIALGAAVRDLEREVGRLLAPRDGTRIKKGGHWRLPKRNAATISKGRDWLGIQLQNRGLTFDESRNAIDAILGSIIEALQDGDYVETPLGEFRIARRPARRRRLRWSKLQILNRTSKRVAFRPLRDLFGVPGGQK